MTVIESSTLQHGYKLQGTGYVFLANVWLTYRLIWEHFGQLCVLGVLRGGSVRKTQ